MKIFRLIAATALIAMIGSSHALSQHAGKRYTIMFYSVENLFDTIDDPAKMDEEFTPKGAKKWNTEKYERKQNNTARVIYELSSAVKGYPAVIGLSEVENRDVLKDLVSRPRLKEANYQTIHYTSPESRGSNVALLYRPDQFKYEGSFPITTVVKETPNFKTRDILSVWGTIDGELFYFFVCNWPSRRGGQMQSEYKRIGAAETLRNAIDSVYNEHPNVNIVVLGDLYDNPYDKSLTRVLEATGSRDQMKKHGLYNPFYEMYADGYGTVTNSTGGWDMFDNIIVSGSLVRPGANKLHIQPSEKSSYYGNIFNRPFMNQHSGAGKGLPLRTFLGNTYLGGFSNHYPIYIFISK